MKKSKRQRRKTVGRIIAAFIILAVVIVIISAVIKSRRDLSVENVLRSISGLWTKTERADHYEYDRSDDFAVIGSGFAAVSQNGLRTFSEDGSEAMLISANLKDGHISACGERAVLYDIGGRTLKYLTLTDTLADIETDTPIITASIDSGNYFTAVCEESGYTTSATVYNGAGDAVYKWYSGEGYIISSHVFDRELYAAVLTEGGSELVKMKLSETEESARCRFDGSVIYDFASLSNRTAAVTDSAVIFLNDKLSETARFEYGGKFLRSFEFTDSGVILTLYDERLSDEGELLLVSSDGQIRHDVVLHGKSVAVGSAKSCAVVTEEGTLVFDRSFKSYREYPVSGKRAFFLKDGALLVAGEFMAEILPLR